MTRQIKKHSIMLSAVLPAVIMAAVLVTAAYLPWQKNTFDREQYRQDLTQIYQTYNTPAAYRAAEEGEQFAFARLLTYDYNGNDYGAVQKAVDEENHFAVLQYADAKAAQQAYEAMLEDGVLADAEGTAQLQDAEKGNLYPAGSQALGTPQYLQKYRMGSDDVIVALVDTGVMYDHEELDGRFLNTGYDYSEDAAATAYFDTQKENPVYGHGTFVAGIIADNTPDSVKILPYKVVPFFSNVAMASSMISAINDAVSAGASVINVSITSASSGNAFRQAVKNAYDHGVCVCAAAGNQAQEIQGLYPASIDEAVTVSALEKDFATFASFSNYGSCVDFCATGRKIVSLAPYLSDSDSRHRTNSGTSFSTPYIAALCADLKTVDNTMAVDDVCGVLADFCVDFGEEGRDDYFGWGMPQIDHITYTDNESYTFSIPQGTLEVYGTKDYTAATQPWRIFAQKFVTVNVDSAVERIGDYNFYNVKVENFTKSETYNKIGKYAFYGCESVKQMNFTTDCEEIGEQAFGGIDGMEIYGYRNTPAEAYALREGIRFTALGCKHDYAAEIFDPTPSQEGYTEYTCTVCGDSYIGAYIQPVLLASGTCGENATWSFYDTGKLVIDGSGAMQRYLEQAPPWSDFAQQICTLQIESGITELAPEAFYNCTALTKIRCYDSPVFEVQNNVLYSKDGSTLILLPRIVGRAYEMPASLTHISALALAPGRDNAITCNTHFTLENSILYDGNGNLAAALPSFTDEELTLEEDISIGDYAFVYTNTLTALHADSMQQQFGAYCVGYGFDTVLQKQALTVDTFDGSTAAAYAKAHGFDVHTYNKGVCGADMQWYFDIPTATLILSGTGDMTEYYEADAIPWSAYRDRITAVEIGEGITSLSDFAFFDATQVRSLTLPLSLQAAHNATVWASCTQLRQITLTLGSGRMDDYATNSKTYYMYSPWYISRHAVQEVRLDPAVRYIGRQAFRGCGALRTITLNACEEIAADAFLYCDNLQTCILTAKNCRIADYALFSYYVTEYSMYTGCTLYGYDDSTAKDYSREFGVDFVSVGCGHSRDTTQLHTEEHPCCLDNAYTYRCADCGSDFTEYVPTTDGHLVSGVLTTLQQKPVAEAELYIDGVLKAVTNTDGSFVAEKVTCGTHEAQFRKGDLTFCTASVMVEQSDVTGFACIAYGDYNADGFINGRDLAHAKAAGITDYRLFDWGSGGTPAPVLDEKTDALQTPYVSECRFEPIAGSPYRQNFQVQIFNPGAYRIVSSGFLYGVEMGEDELVLENASMYAANGYRIRATETLDDKADIKILSYGIKSATGSFGVRFYIIYTNGAATHVYYSDVYRYTYD